MNFIDLFFLLLLVAMLAIGFFQGMIRLIVLLVAFYLSLVLSSLYFPAVATFFQRQFGTQRVPAEYISFVLLMMVSFILLVIAGLYTFRYAKMPGRLQYVDRVIGVVLGVVMAGLLIGILAVVMWNLMILQGGENIDWPFMSALGRGIRRSFLLTYFADTILPQAYDFVDPVLPDGASLIFVVPQ